MKGQALGTLVTSNGHSELTDSAEQLADDGKRLFVIFSLLRHKYTARRGSQALQMLSSHQRASILNTLASLLEDRETEILTANQRDLDAATDLAGPLRSRLSLSSQRLSSLADGLRQLAGQCYFSSHLE